jgi:hypothetical protein
MKKGITLKEMIVYMIMGSVIGVIVPLTMDAHGIGFDHSKASYGYYEFIFPVEEKDPETELIKQLNQIIQDSTKK